MLPAIVAVPDLCEVAVFCIQETVTDPDPEPLAGDALNHESLADAVQLPPVQPEGEPVTVTLCEPAEAVAVADVGEIAKEVQVDTVERS